MRRIFNSVADRMLDCLERQVANKAVEVLSPHVDDIVEGVLDAALNKAPDIRTTGGATTMNMEKIKADFHDFHESDANAAISTFIQEFLAIKYAGQSDFEKANVSEKIKLNLGPKSMSRISNIKINQIAISDYAKSLNSATITYRVSVGFDMGGSRREKLYEVLYTLQLRDEYEESKFLKCSVCDAPLESTNGECKYCGTKHIRDTIENWVVTGVKEK